MQNKHEQPEGWREEGRQTRGLGSPVLNSLVLPRTPGWAAEGVAATNTNGHRKNSKALQKPAVSANRTRKGAA